MVWRGSLYDVTFCLAVWSHVPSREGLCPGTLTEIPLDGDTPRPLDRDPLLCGKEQAVCILLECILLPPANEVWGKVIFLHLSVILFTVILDQVHPPGQVHPPWTGTPPDQVHPPLGPGTPSPGTRYTPLWAQVPPPEQCMLGDTGNKRAVRILLECILVLRSFLFDRFRFCFHLCSV